MYSLLCSASILASTWIIPTAPRNDKKVVLNLLLHGPIAFSFECPSQRLAGTCGHLSDLASSDPHACFHASGNARYGAWATTGETRLPDTSRQHLPPPAQAWSGGL